MSTLYSYALFFNKEKIWDVVKSLSDIATELGEFEIILQTGERIILPFTASSKKSPIMFDDQYKELEFEIELLVEVDDIIKRDFNSTYAGKLGKEMKDNKAPIRMDLRIDFGEKYVLLEFATRSSSEGGIYLSSNSLRNMIIKLLKDHNGIVGIRWCDPNPNETIIWLNGQEKSFQRPFDYDLNPDEYILEFIKTQ